MITTQHVYTAALAGMFLAAGFLLVSILIACGRVIRGKDIISELPTRLIGVSIPLAVALLAWPYARACILDTIGRDAEPMVKTLNSLGNLTGKAGSLASGSGIDLDTSAYSGQDWGDVGSAISEMLSAPAPEPWEDSEAADAADAEPTTTAFEPMVVNDEALAGEMSVNDPSLPPTFPDPTPTPVVTAASYQGAQVTEELQTTVDNNSWLKFHTDTNGQPVTGGMSEPDAEPNMSEEPGTGTDTTTFQTFGGDGTNPPVQPAGTTKVYVVTRGDTMFLIAKAWYGDGNRWPEICQANQPMNCNVVHVGTRLNLP